MKVEWNKCFVDLFFLQIIYLKWYSEKSPGWSWISFAFFKTSSHGTAFRTRQLARWLVLAWARYPRGSRSWSDGWRLSSEPHGRFRSCVFAWPWCSSWSCVCEQPGSRTKRTSSSGCATSCGHNDGRACVFCCVVYQMLEYPWSFLVVVI